MKLSYPSNKICPECGTGGYVWYLEGSKYVAKCTNCGHYFSKEDFPMCVLDSTPKLKTNGDKIRAMTDEELAEYIKREDALHALCEAVHKNKNVPCRNQIVSCLWKETGVQEYAEKIYSIPAADVVERKKGKWKTAYLDHEEFGIRPQVWYCSECQQITSFRTFFCPNCGADMREEPADV